MYKPAFEDFSKLAEDAGMIPVSREIMADLDTPLTVFAKVAGRKDHAFFLESLEGGEKWGRYSIIGFDPILTFESRGSEVVINRGGETRQEQGDPLVILQELLASFQAARDRELLPSFYGGAVGYLGYDMVRFMERLPDINPENETFPDSSFMIPRFVLVFDNLKQTLTIINCVEIGQDHDISQLYEKAGDEIDSLVQTLRSTPVPLDLLTSDGCGSHVFSSNMEKDSFKDMVDRAKEYIRAGDIIQVVLSQRFHTRTSLSLLTIYRALRKINPSPYLFYLKLGNSVQIGSSPEILVRLEDSLVEVRPIAGTRPRGRDQAEDAALEQDLLADPKERAEHLMLVDLGRNDVGRVAEFGTVKTHDLLVIERYSHVMHIVSGVTGRLAAGKDQFDVVRACFPAGTVSGAPKIRAMEIIEELEPERRGPYAGSVGYFGFTGNMDFCITIRTFVMDGEDLWVQAGAGIVADSDPEMEFEETMNKSRGLRRAVELAEKGIF